MQTRRPPAPAEPDRVMAPPTPTDERSARITVLIAEDEPTMQAALAAFLQLYPPFALVGIAANAEDAIQIAASSQPDLALIDVGMPGGGEKAVRGILAR